MYPYFLVVFVVGHNAKPATVVDANVSCSVRRLSELKVMNLRLDVRISRIFPHRTAPPTQLDRHSIVRRAEPATTMRRGC